MSDFSSALMMVTIIQMLIFFPTLTGLLFSAYMLLFKELVLNLMAHQLVPILFKKSAISLITGEEIVL